jgi:hypothetical protein
VDEKVVKFIHGLSFGGSSSPNSQSLGLNGNVALMVFQLT